MLGQHRFRYRLAGLLLVSAVLLAGTPSRPFAAMGDQKFNPGDKAPEFSKSHFLDGKEPKLADLLGKRVLLLNFWGLRCGACLEEMPYLEVIAKKYADKGLTVWGVDTDGVDSQTVLDTLKEVNVSVTYPLIVDPDFTLTDTYTNFLVPLTLVIDKQGIITYIHTGYEKGTEKHYEDAVKKALGI
jgi:peroxiredoxin